MKKFITLTGFILFITILFNSCVKDGFYGVNENYWLSKERGQVVYSDYACNYYVVETNLGFTIIRTYSGYKPADGSIVYGDFSFRGTREIYNLSTDYVFTGTITDYWLSYNQAQIVLNYYCPVYGQGVQREFLKATQL